MPRDRRVLLTNSMYHLTNDGAVAALAGQIIVLQAVFGGFGPAEVWLLGGAPLAVSPRLSYPARNMVVPPGPFRFPSIRIVIFGVGFPAPPPFVDLLLPLLLV